MYDIIEGTQEGFALSIESDTRKRKLNGEPEHKSEYQWKKKANARYNAKFDQIAFRVPKGEKETWKQIAASRGMSLQQYILSLVYADNPDLFPVESEKTE